MAIHHPTDTEEIWKSIPSFPDYEGSSLGRLRRRIWKTGARRLGHILTPVKHSSGYLFYCLRRPDHPRKRFNVYAHIPIAEAFFGPKPDGFEVNHKNGMKSDNRIENLEYISSSENQKHAFRLGLQKGRPGELHHGAKLTEADVREMRAIIKRPIRQRDCEPLADRYGVSWKTIREICRGRSWKHVK